MYVGMHVQTYVHVCICIDSCTCVQYEIVYIDVANVPVHV